MSHTTLTRKRAGAPAVEPGAPSSCPDKAGQDADYLTTTLIFGPTAGRFALLPGRYQRQYVVPLTLAFIVRPTPPVAEETRVVKTLHARPSVERWS